MPYYPTFLETIADRGIVARLNLQAPMVLPHLSEAIDVAAKTPWLGKLYVILIEVRKLIDHLNFLHHVNPQIAVSPWAIHGLDVVRLELGFLIDETDINQALANYRYCQIVLERDMEDGKNRLLLDKWLRKAYDALAVTVMQYEGEAVSVLHTPVEF